MRLLASETKAEMQRESRPRCPKCGRPMKKGKIERGRQQYECGYCYQDDGIWDGLDVVTELPPAVDGVLACQRRFGSVMVRCQYYAECQDNIERGGAALCERVFVLAAGGQRVTL